MPAAVPQVAEVETGEEEVEPVVPVTWAATAAGRVVLEATVEVATVVGPVARAAAETVAMEVQAG